MPPAVSPSHPSDLSFQSAKKQNAANECVGDAVRLGAFRSTESIMLRVGHGPVNHLTNGVSAARVDRFFFAPDRAYKRHGGRVSDRDRTGDLQGHNLAL